MKQGPGDECIGGYICMDLEAYGLLTLHKLHDFYQRKQELEVRLVFEGSGTCIN